MAASRGPIVLDELEELITTVRARWGNPTLPYSKKQQRLDNEAMNAFTKYENSNSIDDEVAATEAAKNANDAAHAEDNTMLGHGHFGGKRATRRKRRKGRFTKKSNRKGNKSKRRRRK